MAHSGNSRAGAGAGRYRAGVVGAVVRSGNRFLVGENCVQTIVANGTDAFAALDEIGHGGFWVGFCAYDLGRAIEHVDARTDDDLGLPDLAFARFDTTRLVDQLPAATSVALGAGRSSLTRAEHAERVESVHELLEAGECYQVNLTRRIAFDAAPDPYALFTQLVAEHPAPHAALCTFGDGLPGVAIVSASPELYLRVDGRSVETRPIKGTARDAATLATSAKDRAENLMIVDLARNDLGRVCEIGSVEVARYAAVEKFSHVQHLVSEVRGRLAGGKTAADALAACFPAGTLTGAPKIRAMELIDGLEACRRGVYGGAVGYFDAAGNCDMAIAIRTAVVERGLWRVQAGAGIVADSVPEREYAEAEAKAAALFRAIELAGERFAAPRGARRAASEP